MTEPYGQIRYLDSMAWTGCRASFRFFIPGGLGGVADPAHEWQVGTAHDRVGHSFSHADKHGM
jgi:hypothetical protein